MDEEEIWSDDEPDWIHQVHEPKPLVVYEEQRRDKLIEDGNLLPCTQPHMFSGVVEMNPKKPLLDREAPIVVDYEHCIDLPYVPFHVVTTLTEQPINLMWRAFTKVGVTKYQVIMVKTLRKLFKDPERDFFPETSYDDLRINEDEEDYVKFGDILDKITQIKNVPGVRPTPLNPAIIPLPPCCATGCCAQCAPATFIKDLKPTVFKTAADHVINVIFNRLRLEKKGRIKQRHIVELLEAANIPYDINRLPEKFLSTWGEYVVKSMDELEYFINTVRVDLDAELAEKANDMYTLPTWLRKEFSPAEIMLFVHNFSVIDIDKGGSIDLYELQELMAQSGGKISTEEAQDLIDEYDTDHSGTIDFTEFMMLIFKIKNGTIDLSDNIFAKVLMEAKSQIKIFEEIEYVQNNPAPHCHLQNYGGMPLSCTFLISGPPGTVYEGGSFQFQVTFDDGYPFKMPLICFLTRIYSINVLLQLDGTGTLIHLKSAWNATWNLHHLLVHVVEILMYPNMDLLPIRMKEITNQWLYLIEQQHIKNEEIINSESTEEEKQHIAVETKKSLTMQFHQVLYHVDILTRVEQLHLHTVSLYLLDQDAYCQAAMQSVIVHAQKAAAVGQSGAGSPGKQEDPQASEVMPEEVYEEWDEEEEESVLQPEHNPLQTRDEYQETPLDNDEQIVFTYDEQQHDNGEPG